MPSTSLAADGVSQAPGKEPAEDPSMEDILASIRRILNEDEVPATSNTPDADPPAASPATPPPSLAEPDVFVLDQTMMIEDPAPVASQEPFAPEHLAPEPAASEMRQPPPAPPPMLDTGAEEPLLAPSTAAAASASMGALVRVLGQQHTPVYRGGPTLEDMVRDEIRPLVKSWLDENLPPMVERMVRAEIARVTGGK